MDRRQKTRRRCKGQVVTGSFLIYIVTICFVDFEKAFDRVKWTKLWHILKKIGIDWRDRRLISNLYLQQETIIRVGNGDTEPAGIGRGLRQGRSLSPILFLIYSEMMMIDAMEEIEEGIKLRLT